MKKYKCPVCKTPLPKKAYEKALGILSARETHYEHKMKELQKKVAAEKTKTRKAHSEGVAVERRRTQRLLAGKDKHIKTLEKRLQQLKRGTTPQTEGLEFEEKLAVRLEKEFPEDQIQRKGKNGDVLQIVRYGKQKAGIIIYECKRVTKILDKHCRQTYRAKQSQHAHFAVLVTTGKKRGFTGFAEMGGVLVVSPLGSIPLASLLRQYLVVMLRTKMTKAKRAKIAGQLVKYITSPMFKNPIEEVINISSNLQDMLRREAKDHFRTWEKRWVHYQKIQWDGTKIRENLKLVLHGKKPKEISHPKIPSLRLPAPSQ